MDTLKQYWNKALSLPALSWLKIGITATAVLCILMRLIWPQLKIDSITLGLLIVAVLPWLTSLIESAEFPGGWKIKFRNIQEAGDRITGDASPPPDQSIPHPSYLAIAERDPNLSLVGLRIEIEKRLRILASRFNLPSNRSLSHMLRELQFRNILTGNVARGLNELIRAGNNAAHGARVEQDVSGWAIDTGPTILAQLDRVIEDTEQPPGAYSNRATDAPSGKAQE